MIRRCHYKEERDNYKNELDHKNEEIKSKNEEIQRLAMNTTKLEEDNKKLRTTSEELRFAEQNFHQIVSSTKLIVQLIGEHNLTIKGNLWCKGCDSVVGYWGSIFIAWLLLSSHFDLR